MEWPPDARAAMRARTDKRGTHPNEERVKWMRLVCKELCPSAIVTRESVSMKGAKILMPDRAMTRTEAFDWLVDATSVLRAGS